MINENKAHVVDFNIDLNSEDQKVDKDKIMYWLNKFSLGKASPSVVLGQISTLARSKAKVSLDKMLIKERDEIKKIKKYYENEIKELNIEKDKIKETLGIELLRDFFESYINIKTLIKLEKEYQEWFYKPQCNNPEFNRGWLSCYSHLKELIKAIKSLEKKSEKVDPLDKKYVPYRILQCMNKPYYT